MAVDEKVALQLIFPAFFFVLGVLFIFFTVTVRMAGLGMLVCAGSAALAGPARLGFAAAPSVHGRMSNTRVFGGDMA
jgi:hypothetical protein